MKYNIQLLNNIATKGLQSLPHTRYQISEENNNPDAILLRSFDMHKMKIPSNLKAIGRAGSGTNNIPIKEMTKRGIVVFNAPGANANAVKELVIAGMLIGARNIGAAWLYSRALEGNDREINKQVEAGKKQFAGFELPGRTLGVVGLGAIGVEVANAARALGMNVLGYDPTITIQRAWQLSSEVEQAACLEDLLKRVDFISFHVPLLDSTRHMINADMLKTMKDGVVILNFSRNGIIDDDAVCSALEVGKVYNYICDFPSNCLKKNPRVMALPHLGASTREAEENCAVMVATQVKDYLENGNVYNSVNLPNIVLPRAGRSRIALINENRPDMVGKISRVLGQSSVNIAHMINDSKGSLAATLIDVETEIDALIEEQLSHIDGVLSLRIL